ncbi:MAG: c-type cytochrome biogenesis protein CcsB [Coriobacteriia bacterium]
MRAADLLFWCSLAVSAAAWVLSCAAVRGSGVSRASKAAALIASAALTSAIALRWVLTSHPPIFGAFENTLASAWTALVWASWLSLRPREDVPRLAVGTLTGWATLVLAAGAFAERTPYPLTISERSLWVDVHALFAWVAFTALLLVSVSGALGAVRAQVLSEEQEAFLFRLLGGGFAFLTAMLAVGALYSFLLFGDWYRWEIVGTLAAATWLVYAVAVHLRLFFGWSGRRWWWVLAAALPLVIATFWVWSVFPATYHYFNIPEIRPF